MTKETQILPEYDYELRFDAEEVGATACTYFGLVTDYGSPADILVRFPTVGFGRHEENAREKAEALAKEIVRRWNTETAIKYKAAFHKDDRYLTTDDGQVFDRNNNRFVPDDELEAINTYEKVSTTAIADGVGEEWQPAETAPKDGSRIIAALFVPYFELCGPVIGGIPESKRKGWSFRWASRAEWSEERQKWHDGLEGLAAFNFWMPVTQPQAATDEG